MANIYIYYVYNMYIHTYTQCEDHKERKRERRKRGNNKPRESTYVLLVPGRMRHANVADEKM